MKDDLRDERPGFPEVCHGVPPTLVAASSDRASGRPPVGARRHRRRPGSAVCRRIWINRNISLTALDAREVAAYLLAATDELDALSEVRGDDIRVDDVSHVCRAVSDQRPHCDRCNYERRSRSRQMGGPGADLAGAPTITGRAAVTAHLQRSVVAALAALGLAADGTGSP
jgi:hypothetical protein